MIDDSSMAMEFCEPNVRSDGTPCGRPAARRHFFNIAHGTPSPALRARTPAGLPAFEMKFVIDASRAGDLEHYFASRLQRDPHGDPAASHTYRVTSIYTDTSDFDVFQRKGSHKYRKLRARRYGDETETYLERKTKRGRKVRKKRTAVSPQELRWLAAGYPLEEWRAEWYRRSVVRRGLNPVCRISYVRSALLGVSDFGTVRVTFDRELNAAPVLGWTFDAEDAGKPLPTTGVICEFKFHGTLPSLFKDALQQFELLPQGFSKFRTAIQALGLGPHSEGASHA
jgi:hypothetical protein